MEDDRLPDTRHGPILRGDRSTTAGQTPASPRPREGDFQESSRRFWERRYGRPLSDEELREIRRNMTELAKILLGWDKKAKASARHPGVTSTPPDESSQQAEDEGDERP